MYVKVFKILQRILYVSSIILLVLSGEKSIFLYRESQKTWATYVFPSYRRSLKKITRPQLKDSITSKAHSKKKKNLCAKVDLCALGQIGPAVLTWWWDIHTPLHTEITFEIVLFTFFVLSCPVKWTTVYLVPPPNSLKISEHIEIYFILNGGHGFSLQKSGKVENVQPAWIQSEAVTSLPHSQRRPCYKASW